MTLSLEMFEEEEVEVGIHTFGTWQTSAPRVMRGGANDPFWGAVTRAILKCSTEEGMAEYAEAQLKHYDAVQAKREETFEVFCKGMRGESRRKTDLYASAFAGKAGVGPR